MTAMTWEYRNGRSVTSTFEMLLGFEESPTLEALRAFVSATSDMPADADVAFESTFRPGHENVVKIVARTSSNSRAVTDGPQRAAAHEAEPQ